MDDFRGGKFIVGSDIRADEQRRMANEYMRSQNESQRMSAEGSRNNATANALGIANTHSRNNFLTQVGMFTAVVLTVVILAVIAILAYEKAYNNQSLVDLDNLRDLKLTNLEVYETTTTKTLDISGATSSTGNITTTGDVTSKDITTTGDATVGDDLVVTGGASINQGLSVGQKAIFDDDVWVKGGLSVDGGMSVGGTTYFYGQIQSDDKIIINDEVWIKEGLSVSGGLSIDGTTNFYGTVITNSGVSIENGMSISGTTNLYGDLVSTAGISTSGGLSVGGTAIINIGQIKKDKVVLTNTLEGVSTGYNLTTDNAGNTYIIQNEYDGVSASNSFILPQLSGATDNGLKYNFLWDENDSAAHRNFKIHTYDSNNNIFGTVLSAEKGSSVFTIAQDETDVIVNRVNTGPPVLFHYDGKVYPGSQLECSYIGGNWLLAGRLGASSSFNNNNGFIGTTNPLWIAGGLSTNNPSNEEIIVSYNGTHFYEANSNAGVQFFDIVYGLSSDGTSLYVGGGTATIGYSPVNMRYSTDGICWLASSEGDNNIVGRAVAFGLSQGVSRWVATGYRTGSTTNLIYSDNGTSWQSCTGISFSGINTGFGVKFGLSSDGTSLWVATGQNSAPNSTILYSTNGINWQNSTGVSFSGGAGSDIAYGVKDDGTKRWVAVGYQASGSGLNNLLYSDDGTSWQYCTGTSFGNNGLGNTVNFGLSSDGTSIWVAGGRGTNTILYSIDGISWQPSTGDTLGNSGDVFHVVYGNRWTAIGQAVAGGTKNITYSEDGITWTYVSGGDYFQSGGGECLAYNKPLYPNPDNAVEN